MFNRLVLCVFALGMSGQPNHGSQKQYPRAAQSQPAVTPADSIDKQTSSGNDQTETTTKPPLGNTSTERTKVWWRDSNWWLVAVAAFTGIFIAWQAWETRKTAEATRAAYYGWLELGNWTGKIVRLSVDEEMPKAFISVDIINATNFPITIKEARIALGKESFIRYETEDTLISPRTPIRVDFSYYLSKASLHKYFNSAYVVWVSGEISFAGVLPGSHRQKFGGFLRMMPKGDDKHSPESVLEFTAQIRAKPEPEQDS